MVHGLAAVRRRRHEEARGAAGAVDWSCIESRAGRHHWIVPDARKERGTHVPHLDAENRRREEAIGLRAIEALGVGVDADAREEAVHLAGRVARKDRAAHRAIVCNLHCRAIVKCIVLAEGAPRDGARCGAIVLVCLVQQCLVVISVVKNHLGVVVVVVIVNVIGITTVLQLICPVVRHWRTSSSIAVEANLLRET